MCPAGRRSVAENVSCNKMSNLTTMSACTAETGLFSRALLRLSKAGMDQMWVLTCGVMAHF